MKNEVGRALRTRRLLGCLEQIEKVKHSEVQSQLRACEAEQEQVFQSLQRLDGHYGRLAKSRYKRFAVLALQVESLADRKAAIAKSLRQASARARAADELAKDAGAVVRAERDRSDLLNVLETMARQVRRKSEVQD